MSTQYKILIGDTATPQARVPKTGEQTYLAPVTLNDSSGTELAFEVGVIVNQSGSGGYIANYINVTHTATGSGSKLLAQHKLDGTIQYQLSILAEQHFRELSSTPSAIAGMYSIYCKTDDLLYYQDGAGNEHAIAHSHGCMYDEDNTDAFVINDSGGDFHSYHTNGLALGANVVGWSFDAGGNGTSFPIASIADGADTGVDIAVTTTGNHLLSTGDIISQTNLSDAAYVGIFQVKAIISATIYEVAASYTASGTGTMDQAAVLIAGANAGGIYIIGWSASATSATNNETFDFKMYLNATVITGSSVRRKFGTATDFGAWAAHAPHTPIVAGDKISLVMANQDTAGDLTLRHLNIGLQQV